MARCGSVLTGALSKDDAIPHDGRKCWNFLPRDGLSLVSREQ
jgi:hypothetical protein